MKRWLILLFGVAVYGLFLLTFLYQVGFLANILVPKTINDGEVVSLREAILVNVGILALFGIQHTIMARITFKKWWTKIVPPSMERSIFVLVTSALLLLLNWQWRPLPEVVWQFENPVLCYLMYGISFAGWGIVLYATFLINHFDLFGLRQVWLQFKGQEHTKVEFKENMLYSLVRHPLMLGFMIAFWATPTMTEGHLLFAAVVSAYALIGITIEERTLVALHGNDYREYQQRVPMLVPMPGRLREVLTSTASEPSIDQDASSIQVSV